MTNATDNAVTGFFSDEAELIKKRSWTSLWIGMGLSILSVLLMLPFGIVFLVKPILGILLFGVLSILFFVGVFFIFRFAYFRMKLAKCVGDQIRAHQEITN
jgi:hypothetical protein